MNAIHFTRRQFMAGAAAALFTSAEASGSKDAGIRHYTLTASKGTQLLDLELPGETDIWSYNGQVPGPLIRLKQSEILSVDFRNELSEGTSVHWHGIRIDNSMDGTVGMTQASVLPGKKFHYEFSVPDAGTYWYHAHQRSSEQVGRGLYGALIVDEPIPPDVDEDVLLVLDDWRLDSQGRIHPSFGNLHDISHAGRTGNWLTVNGRGSEVVQVRENDRLRLRLVNAANSLVMPLVLPDWDVWVIALDGMPVPKPLKLDSELALAPGQRADLMVDVPDHPSPDETISFLNRDSRIPLASFHRTGGSGPMYGKSPPALPSNPVLPASAIPDQSHPMVLEGGAMGRLQQARFQGEMLDIRTLARKGKVWSQNGIVDRPDAPFLSASRGSTQEILFENRTAWPHAMHLHGHHLEVSHDMAGFRNKGTGSILRDTVLVPPGETVPARFLADNPGRWLLHCHMLEHQAGGMVTWLEVL